VSDFGLLPDGFVVPTIDEIITDYQNTVQNNIGKSMRTGNTTLLGQLIAILAEQVRLLWEAEQATYSASDPDSATGSALEVLCALTGTLRPRATQSLAALVLTGVPLTSIPINTLVKSLSTGAQFSTQFPVALVGLTSWVGSTAYAVGARVTNASRSFQCITAGTSAATGGPNLIAADVADGSAHWTYLGEGSGASDVTALSVAFGPVSGVARDIARRVSAIVGWSSVINLLDVDLGRNQATDAELRLLREAELAGGGSGTQDSIRTELLKATSASAVTVFVNSNDTVDSDGLPGHSIEALVQISTGADNDQLVFDTLLANVGAGIKTHGSGPGLATGIAVDSEGTPHTMKFTRPADILIYVDITVTVDALNYPADGDQQIKNAIAAYGAAQAAGFDAVASRIGAQAFKVPGLLDVPRSGSLGGCLIKASPTPTSDVTLTISKRQIAKYDTSRITVHSSAGVP
jgi:hypothetical protein